jgi:hypothetical protein
MLISFEATLSQENAETFANVGLLKIRIFSGIESLRQI